MCSSERESPGSLVGEHGFMRRLTPFWMFTCADDRFEFPFSGAAVSLFANKSNAENGRRGNALQRS